MTDIEPITDEQIKSIMSGKFKTPEHAYDNCVARIEADRELIAKVIAIAGADPGDIDGAILMLKERQRQIGLQSQELGQLRKRIAELEKQCAGYKDFIDGDIALQHDLERDVFERDNRIAELEAEVERLREIERKYNSGQVMHCEVNDCQIKRGQNAQLSIHVESSNVNPDFARIIDHADRCKVRVIFEINESEPTDDE